MPLKTETRDAILFRSHDGHAPRLGNGKVPAAEYDHPMQAKESQRTIHHVLAKLSLGNIPQCQLASTQSLVHDGTRGRLARCAPQMSEFSRYFYSIRAGAQKSKLGCPGAVVSVQGEQLRRCNSISFPRK